MIASSSDRGVLLAMTQRRYSSIMGKETLLLGEVIIKLSNGVLPN